MAFNRQDNAISGYAIVEEKGEYANYLVHKTIPAQEKIGVNMALVDGILNDYAERLADGGILWMVSVALIMKQDFRIIW